MPAAASENVRGMFFGTDLANRRCRERREAIGRTKWPEGVQGKPGASRKTNEGRNRSAGRKLEGSVVRKGYVRTVKLGTAHWNRQVEGRAFSEADPTA